VTRVLLVHQPTDGGVARHVGDLAAGLRRRGHEVVICGPEPIEQAADADLYRRLEMDRALAPRADLAAVASLARIVRETRPDLVHAHSSKAGAIARLARAAAPRVPVLYSAHGYAFVGHFGRDAERRAYRSIERVLAPLASRVVCVCEAEARLARRLGPAAKVRVVHNGIATPAARAPDARVAALRRRGPLLCALTLLRPGKGVETLIDALPAVLRDHPDAQLAIAGGGADLAQLRDRALQAGVGDQTHFLGPISSPEALLAAADVFVHASWVESFPYVILEAMAAGLPIVASDVGGVGEAVADGETGLLVPVRDSGRLAAALVALLGDEGRRATFGSAGRARVGEIFTLERMVGAVASVYDELIPAPLR
jgi:glycosyltransferase involved in cell wall biosynthesis